MLAACTIEVGPPPESDPPLVPVTEQRPPPPEQPSEPQPWSRDLDFEAGPTRIDRKVLAEGLVAEESQVTYSRERLTYQSAFDPEKPPSEAELARQRAKARAEAAGLPPPPQVAAAPVSSVSAESLPASDEAAAPRRESRLPPPPKFPPLPPKEGEAAPTGNAQASGSETAAAPEDAAWAQRQSRLPAPPKFPPLPAEAQAPETTAPDSTASETTAPEATAPGPVASATVASETVATEPVVAEAPAPEPAPEAAVAATGEPVAPETGPASDPVVPVPQQLAAVPEAPVGDAETAAFLAEAWDAPRGTILVQVSAVQKKMTVLDEWSRLRSRYPQVLEPLRLVVDEAKLGERGVFYRVQAGAFGTPEGAMAACDALISQGQSCFVVVR